MIYLDLILVTVLGLTIGSFLNAVIHRLPRQISFGISRSACVSCDKTIRLYDNIPLLSFLILRGKCRDCGAKISWRYPLVEALNTVVYLGLFWRFGFSLELAMVAVLSSALIAILFIDLEHLIIPDRITIPGMIAGLLYSLTPAGMGILQSAIGLVVGGGALYLIAVGGDWLFKKESMGGGDIKMAAMLGAFLGWQKALLVFMLSAVIGLLVSIVVLSVSKRFRQERMLPFGPFLALATFVAAVYGEQLIDFYLRYALR